MKKPLMSVDPESHDDVAGLFKRLGRRDASGGYQDFSSTRQKTTQVVDASGDLTMPVVPETPAPVAAPVVVEAVVLGTAVDEVALASPVVLLPTARAAVDLPPSPPVVDGAATPLQQLFQRLVEAPLDAAAGSPLARLRQR